MSKLYDDPDSKYRHITVADPDPKVDEPPAPDEGQVLDVDFEHRYATATDANWVRCQICPRTICKGHPHIMAFVHLEAGLGAFKRAYFCSRECWAEWASRS